MKCSYQPRAAPHHWRGTSKYHMPNYDQTHSQLLQYVFRLTPLFLQWNHVGENHDQELWDILWLPFHNTRRWLIRTWRDSCCGAFYRWISEGRFGHEKMSTHLDWNTEPIRKWFTRLKNFTSVSLNTSFQECCIARRCWELHPHCYQCLTSVCPTTNSILTSRATNLTRLYMAACFRWKEGDV